MEVFKALRALHTCVTFLRLIIYTSRLRFAAMEHRGELLEAAIRYSGIPVTRIVKNLNRSRRWLYNQFSRPDVPLDVMLEIGKIIRHDFSTEIQDLRSDHRTRSILAEGLEVGYGEQSVQFWKDKYLKLLEEYNDLLKKQK